MDLARRLTRSLKLRGREERYFLDLVRLEKVKQDPDASLPLMENLARLRTSGTYKYLDHRMFSAISEWYYYAIRQMVYLSTFREDVSWIANHLMFPVTPRQVSDAIDTLLRFGLIKKVRGVCVVSDEHLDTTSDVADEAIKRFHEQALENAKVAIRKFSPEEREFYGTTFSVAECDLPKAKELIRKFHREFCSVLQKENTDSVFHLEVAFHPVARGEKR